MSRLRSTRTGCRHCERSVAIQCGKRWRLWQYALDCRVPRIKSGVLAMTELCSALDAEPWLHSPMVLAAQGSASSAEHRARGCVLARCLDFARHERGPCPALPLLCSGEGRSPVDRAGQFWAPPCGGEQRPPHAPEFSRSNRLSYRYAVLIWIRHGQEESERAAFR